jgi:hypothetical protein
MKAIEALIMQVIPHDKCLHVIAGMLIFAATHFAAWWIGMAVVVLVGFLKELLDHFTEGDVSVWDVVATIAGGLVGLLCFAR